jgi:CHAT domain-containing protein
VALVSSYAGFPIELVGDPPLATRYAVGRLSGPDLPATALLVARAALSEDVHRPPDIRAVLAECADAVPGKPVPEARAEVQALTEHLNAQPQVRTHLVTGDRDLSEFLPASARANLIHFAGHCWFDGQRSGECGLIFREGVLTTGHLSSAFTGLPIVFTNACETGLLTRADDGQGVLWTGIASAFLAAGAVNYVGSLWPVFDEGSRRIAEVFYDRLCAGEPVGEALRLARLDGFERHDPGWTAYVLFGCPRNRLRPSA